MADVVFVNVVDGGSIECKGYTGIGLKTNIMGIVVDVSPNGPAMKAGVQEGDILDNKDDFSPDTLPIGTTVTLLYSRNDKQFVRKAKIERICYT